MTKIYTYNTYILYSVKVLIVNLNLIIMQYRICRYCIDKIHKRQVFIYKLTNKTHTCIQHLKTMLIYYHLHSYLIVIYILAGIGNS